MPQTATLAQARTLPALALWHLLSLDAPTVATLWLVFAARETHTALPSLLAPAMFLAVWLIYAADRLLDAVRPYALQPRHHFHQQHAPAFLAAMAAATLALSLLLGKIRLPPAYLPLAASLLAWFAAVHIPRIPAALRLPKELATGIIFAAAIFAPELPHHWPEALAFAALCTCNCAWISRWEIPQPTHPLTRRLLHAVPQLTAALLLAALRPTPIGLAIALAAAALLLLDRTRRHFHPTLLRAVADLALLTPVFFLVHPR